MTRDESENLLSDLIDSQLHYLRGEGPEPSLADLPSRHRAEAQRLLHLVEALADSLPASPPLSEDPVAIQLGLAEATEGDVWPLRNTDPIMVSVQELSHRLGGAIHSEVASGHIPDDSCGGLICHSLGEVVFVVVVTDVDEPFSSRHALPIFHDHPELSGVAFCNPDATRASVVTYNESVERLIPARDWEGPTALVWEPLGIVLGRHFERSIPRWDEVNRLTLADSVDFLKIEITRAIEEKIDEAARSRPRLAHKRHARDFVVNVNKLKVQSWVDAVRGNRISGDQLAAEIADVCEAVTS